MDKLIEDSSKIIATLGNLFKKEGLVSEYQVLSEGDCVIEVVGYDNWNGGTDIYGIFCKVNLDLYSKIESEIESIEETIKKKAETLLRLYSGCWIGEVVVAPQLTSEIQNKIYKVSSEELLIALEQQKSLMVSVSTGGPQIKLVDHEYKSRLPLIREGLSERNIKDANLFNDLWGWHGKWSDGSLSTYKSRRQYLGEMFDPMIALVKNLQSQVLNPIFEEPTGWFRVDRNIGEIKLRLAQSSTEEQYQAIGLLGRETLISLAEVVYDRGLHPTIDGVVPSKTDTKRMLEAYISVELRGKSNENIRRHAKASLDLANDLTHRRTADYRLAALCAEAANAVVNIIAIISGRRDK